ncbi:MAG: AlpA family transcriptional regulator [Desulfovibrionaceae bacterium]|nr:AlpA family transcriptional regulator [Desulfovibrionaceae bacterium]
MNDLSIRFIRRKEVEALTGLSRSSIYAMMSNGNFPKPLKLSTRAVGWTSHDLEAWMESKIVATRQWEDKTH